MKTTAFLLALFAGVQFLSAQTWTQIAASSNDWQCLASSADGTRLVAGANPGPLYVSTNSGTTWSPTIVSNEYWVSVASSADGIKLIAAAPSSGGYPGGIYLSTNAGCTWVSNDLSGTGLYWSDVASSADGRTLAVAAPLSTFGSFSLGIIFSSTNSGATWISNNLEDVTGVAMSADGNKMVAVGFQVCLSTNSGVTWVTNTAAPFIGSWRVPSQIIASSADGNKLVLCVLPSIFYPGSTTIYVSTNFGDAWNPAPTPVNNWGFVASSGDGNTFLVSPNFTQFGPICVSTNSGTTWSTNNSPFQDWGALASSADGGKLVAVAAANVGDEVTTGVIYTSQSIQSPLLDLTPASGSVTLSWLIPSADFVLEQSPDLINWLEVTNTPVLNLNNLQDEVVLSNTNNLGFYRLKTP